MPLTYTIDRERRRVESVLEGELTRSMILEYYADVLADPELEGFEELADARGITRVTVTLEEIKLLARESAEIQKSTKPRRTAFVMDSLVFYGMARMYETFAEIAGDPREIRVFRDMDEAEEWLAEGRAGGGG